MILIFIIVIYLYIIYLKLLYKKGSKDIMVRLKELSPLDMQMDEEMTQTVTDIEEYQKRLRFVDGEFSRELKKGDKCDDRVKYRIVEARRDIVADMEGTSFLERAERLLHVVAPAVASIARMISSVILAILNLGVVRERISQNTLAKMIGVYNTSKRYC